MRLTRVPCKVTSKTKLRGAQRTLEIDLRSTDFRAPENLIFQTLLIGYTHFVLPRENLCTKVPANIS